MEIDFHSRKQCRAYGICNPLRKQCRAYGICNAAYLARMWHYIEMNEFRYPSPGPIPLESFVNEAGVIQNLREGTCGGVAIIESLPGSVRSNHYHRTDSHLLYVLSGALLYFERPIGSKDMPDPYHYSPGHMFYTPPNVEHACLFLDHTVLVSVSERPRDHESHEQDVERVEFLDKGTAFEWFRKYGSVGTYSNQQGSLIRSVVTSSGQRVKL